MSTYLDRTRGQHDEIRSRIETLTASAVTEDRELTEDELRSVTEDGAKAQSLATLIETLHEQETRAAKVAALAPVENRTAGGAKTEDRDPGHYRTATDGGKHSFFGDAFRAKFSDDSAAATRLREHGQHMRAGLSVAGTGGPGIVPPKWMTDLYLPLSRQTRVVANQVTHLPIGDDPRAIVLPRQTAGTDAVVATQTENVAVSGADAFNTATETLTPAAIAGKQTVSRQLVDSATPAVDQLIFADLLAVYDAQIESLVTAALVTAAGAAVATFATEAAYAANAAGTGSVAYNGLVDMETAIWKARFLPATLFAVSPTRYGALRKLAGQDGRPLLTPYGPMNNVGSTDGSAVPNGLVGEIAGLPVFVTSGLTVAPAAAESHLATKASDTLLAEGDGLQFRFEEVAGPQQIVLGIWRYAGVLVRQAGNGTRRNVVTAAGA